MTTAFDVFLRQYDWLRFREKYEKADDRSCVILFTAYLDNCVTAALLANVVHPSECEKRLLSETAPLGSLSARIDLLRVLGLIDEASYRDLHFIRKIRNQFAHEMRVDAFAEEQVKSWCAEFQLPRHRGDKEHLESLRNDLRTLFIVACALCEWMLLRVRERGKNTQQAVAADRPRTCAD